MTVKHWKLQCPSVGMDQINHLYPAVFIYIYIQKKKKEGTMISTQIWKDLQNILTVAKSRVQNIAYNRLSVMF